MRKLTEKEVVLATHNQGKVRELQAMLAPFGVKVLSADDLHLSEPEETGDTFVANAKLKAESATLEAKMPALADDSGLCVNTIGKRKKNY